MTLIFGNGYASFFVTSFRARESRHNRLFPFDFFTKTIGELQLDSDSSITPYFKHPFNFRVG